MTNITTERTEEGLIFRMGEASIRFSNNALLSMTEQEAFQYASQVLESKAQEPAIPKWRAIKQEVMEAIEQGIVYVKRLDNYPNRDAILREAARLGEIDNPTFWIVNSLYLPKTPHKAHDFLVEQANRRTLFEDDFKFLYRDLGE